MMSRLDDTETEAKTTPQARRRAAWSGIAGALLLGAAAYLVLSSSPAGTGSDAVRNISDFYSEGGNRSGLLVAEPLSIVGGFFLLWFLGHLAGRLRTAEVGAARYADSALAGGATFIVLAFASLTASTTVAGLMAFSSAFEADPHTAMLFSHLAYVLLAGAMVGAAVLLAAAGSQIRRTQMIPRWLGTAAYVLAPISILAFPFIYLAVALFLIWILLVSGSMLRESQTPA